MAGWCRPCRACHWKWKRFKCLGVIVLRYISPVRHVCEESDVASKIGRRSPKNVRILVQIIAQIISIHLSIAASIAFIIGIFVSIACWYKNSSGIRVPDIIPDIVVNFFDIVLHNRSKNSYINSNIVAYILADIG